MDKKTTAGKKMNYGKIVIGIVVIASIYLSVAYWQKLPPFTKKLPTTPPAATTTTSGGNTTAGSGGLFDGPGDNVTYVTIDANLPDSDKILRYGVKDARVKELKNRINEIRASAGQNPIPVNEYFGIVCKEALEWASSTNKLGKEANVSISEISFTDLTAELAIPNKLKTL